MGRLQIRAALLFLTLALALAPAAFSSDVVKIVDVGLQGYYLDGNPAVVRVLLIHTDARSATIELRVHVHTEFRPQVERIDTFTQIVTLAPNEQRVVDVPVVIPGGGIQKVEVEEADGQGTVSAKDSAPLSGQSPYGLIALMCLEQRVCQVAQAEISFSGAPQVQAAKGKQLKFVSLQYAPEEWLGYEPARTVVLAEPVAAMSPAQWKALEDFVREGGTLIVVQDLVADPSFLAPYRAQASRGIPNIVGRGKVLWIPSLQSGELGALYDGPGVMRAIASWQAVNARGSEIDWARNRLTTQFQFPTLKWLLAWLAAYILIAGVGSFIFLRVIGRREWGWVTLPCLSVLFALGMYFSSASNRPKQFLVEDVTFYWMDENSSVAAVERGERVSAPHRQTLNFLLNDKMIFAGDRNRTGDALSVNPFENDSPDQIINHWDVKTGPPVDVTLRMLQWSFRDLEFFGIELEPGTVRATGPDHLRNETGKSFTQALYVDKDTMYSFDAIAAGADINLADGKRTPLAKSIGARGFGAFGFPSMLSETDPDEMAANAQQAAQQAPQQGNDQGTQPDNAFTDMKGLSKKPFELAELIHGWPTKGNHVFDSRSALFFGLSTEPGTQVSLSGVPFSRKSYSITVVSFERKP